MTNVRHTRASYPRRRKRLAYPKSALLTTFDISLRFTGSDILNHTNNAQCQHDLSKLLLKKIKAICIFDSYILRIHLCFRGMLHYRVIVLNDDVASAWPAIGKYLRNTLFHVNLKHAFVKNGWGTLLTTDYLGGLQTFPSERRTKQRVVGWGPDIVLRSNKVKTKRGLMFIRVLEPPASYVALWSRSINSWS